ncbi:unnamed protein product [Bursaphelenchus okinawaensis]|uniref:Uncharacterized protein n=1 Tax=Bursaphelenchus okinawaensis TaxID=465554 RepID=A0A811KNS4_9BILA|nr:unnamed protein product [Bursaphelenchus okinawaensis]CAG9106063.1 unnamed protein product [Bursaphelenchus okinawaensis]
MKPGQSITADTYCAQIDKLRHNLPTMVRRRVPIILQDNARPHAAKKTVAKFRELGYEDLEHPPYSPDLVPTDFHLFKHLSSFLNGRIFKTPDDAKNAFKNFINSRNPEFYNRGIKKLLNRHASQCGSDSSLQDVFQPSDYSKSACQWLAKIKDVRERCHCEPVLSPRNRKMFQNTTGSKTFADNENTVDLATGRKPDTEYPICTIADEVFCVQSVLEEPISEKTQKFLTSCVNDCDEVSFTTIVFGNDLHSSDITHYLPGDWEDEKEKRLANFQLALENLPKNRISLVRHIQKLADDAKHFMNESIRIFGVKKESEDAVFPCFNTSQGLYPSEVYEFHQKESLWNGLNEFLETEFPVHFAKSLKLFNLELDQNLRLRDDYDSSEKSEETYLTMSTEALYYLRVFENQANSGRGVKGLDSIQSFEKRAVGRHLLNFLNKLQECVVKIQFKPPEQARNLTKPCRKMLLSYHSVLFNARSVAKTISTEALQDFDTGVKGLTAVLRKLKYGIPGSIFTINNYNVDLRMFRKLYKEGGQGNELLVELLRFRKFIQSGAVDEIKKFVDAVEVAVEAREDVIKQLDLRPERGAVQPMKFAQETAKCMAKMVEEIEVIRKSPMIRAELMSRIIHAVTVAQSYSPGPEYDRVNLLFLKIYFAHFKEEIITQERSYNVFLLLAEIGGTIGLYVGAALLSVAETVVFFFEKHTLNPTIFKHPA